MTDTALRRFAPFRASDRNFFLLALAAIWAGILAGFVQDILEHFIGKHVSYAIVVHIHAVAFVGWLVLLTIQISLVRSGRTDLHRRLGVAAVVMIPLMVVLGLLTALTMSRLELHTPDGDAPFLIVQFQGIFTFAVIAVAGLTLRKDAAAHKRLMLLATISICDAGFARWLGAPLGKLLGHGVAPSFVGEYFGSVLMIAAMIVYDLATRRNLPAWKPIATSLPA